MGRWDGHTEQQKQEAKDRKRAKESAKRKAERQANPTLRSKPVTRVLVLHAPEPTRDEIRKQIIERMIRESFHLTSATETTTQPTTEAHIVQSSVSWKGRKPGYVNRVYYRSQDPTLLGNSLMKWIRKQPDKELQRQLWERYRRFCLEAKRDAEEFQRMLEQIRCTPWSVLMDHAKKEVQQEIERRENEYEYFKQREAEQQREKNIRKPRKQKEQEWYVLSLLERAFQPAVKGSFRLATFREKISRADIRHMQTDFLRMRLLDDPDLIGYFFPKARV